MKWLKIFWHFVLRHLPRWLHIAAHEVEKAHQACPECENYPYLAYDDKAVYTVDCRNCDLFKECKDYDAQLRKE